MHFDLIPHLSITPSKCVFCGSVAGPFVVSRGPDGEEVWIENYGIVAVCAENTEERAGCLIQAARLAGSVDAPVHEKVERQADYWKTIAGEQAERLKAWSGLSDAAAKIRSDAPDRRDGKSSGAEEPGARRDRAGSAV